MHKEGDEIHIDDDAASAGETSGRMRWVLGIGTALAIGLLTIIWMTGALTQGDVEEEATVTGEILSTDDEGDNTDSIIMEEGDSLDDTEEVGGNAQ
ncbi:hypothetical protein SAMN06297468_1956 [Altererythrobacter xiamenensis]|uniref:Uncharacterized protein n=1 Tax=Altererythrobacter xiamenensis TaxID=1316679 RepID=A0A1Y6F8T9_9SPHN|nr:hypothetical protein [Altererythrobacter xiamenensis]SMQ69770.1 hypothetical protein SAMN06297468_1956 [Altererythrobacter xiamenensis]